MDVVRSSAEWDAADGSFDSSKWKQLCHDLRKLDTQSELTSSLAFTTPLALPSVTATRNCSEFRSPKSLTALTHRSRSAVSAAS